MKSIIISANVIFTIANFRKELIKDLIINNFKVICVSDEDKLSHNSKDILNSLGVTFEKVSVSRKGLNPIDDIKYFFSLLNIYKKYKPDIIMHFTIKPNIYGTIAARLLGIKSINTINGLGSAMIVDNFLSKILKIMYKVSLTFSSAIFFQNPKDKLFFEEQNIIRKKISFIVPGSGVDINYFKNCKKNINSKKIFLLIARLLKDKGIYEYIKAIKIIKKKYHNAEFLLAGSFDNGNPTSIQKEEIKKWEKNNLVKYLGQTDDIREFFKLCDIVVLPSYREGLSRVLIEATSSSKPIVATDVPGCNDIVIDDVNGYLCQAKDISSLAQAMEKMILISDTEFRTLSNNSFKIAKEKFNREIVNKIYLNKIEKLLK